MNGWQKTLRQESFTIQFSGDSGDGIQLLGKLFAETLTRAGWHVRTQADFPAEIRAPRGTLRGVSSFQIQAFQTNCDMASGQTIDLLVAMNPAAILKQQQQNHSVNQIVYDQLGFGKRALKQAGLNDSWLEQIRARGNIQPIPTETILKKPLMADGYSIKLIDRSRNLFFLSLLAKLALIDESNIIQIAQSRLGQKKELWKVNRAAMEAGAEAALKIFETPLTTSQGPAKSQTRLINGNEAVALALLTASHLAKRPLFYSSYPITPASEVLHELAKLRSSVVNIHQAEDEIAAIGAALGASFGGHLAACATSGPGLSLKSEFLGLAVMAELPLLIIDVQRGGPSTGMPTKTSQGDLMQALYGRHGDSLLPVLACSSPSDCFATVLEAARMAVSHMTPVIILSDASLAFGSEDWQVPDIHTLPPILNQTNWMKDDFKPYARDPENASRAWVAAGTEGGVHCLGGLEKEPISGKVSSSPQDHERMSQERKTKIETLEQVDLNPAIFGSDADKLLVISWGSTFSSVRSSIKEARDKHLAVAHLHLKQISPRPHNLREIIRRFPNVLIAELNDGQLYQYLGGDFQDHVASYTEQSGLGLTSERLMSAIANFFVSEICHASPEA